MTALTRDLQCKDRAAVRFEKHPKQWHLRRRPRSCRRPSCPRCPCRSPSWGLTSSWASRPHPRPRHPRRPPRRPGQTPDHEENQSSHRMVRCAITYCMQHCKGDKMAVHIRPAAHAWKRVNLERQQGSLRGRSTSSSSSSLAPASFSASSSNSTSSSAGSAPAHGGRHLSACAAVLQSFHLCSGAAVQHTPPCPLVPFHRAQQGIRHCSAPSPSSFASSFSAAAISSSSSSSSAGSSLPAGFYRNTWLKFQESFPCLMRSVASLCSWHGSWCGLHGTAQKIEDLPPTGVCGGLNDVVADHGRGLLCVCGLILLCCLWLASCRHQAAAP